MAFHGPFCIYFIDFHWRINLMVLADPVLITPVMDPYAALGSCGCGCSDGAGGGAGQGSGSQAETAASIA